MRWNRYCFFGFCVLVFLPVGFGLFVSPPSVYFTNVTSGSVAVFVDEPVLFSSTCTDVTFNQTHIVFMGRNATAYEYVCQLFFSSKQTPESVLVSAYISLPRNVSIVVPSEQPLVIASEDNYSSMVLMPTVVNSSPQENADLKTFTLDPTTILLCVACVLMVIGLIKR